MLKPQLKSGKIAPGLQIEGEYKRLRVFLSYRLHEMMLRLSGLDPMLIGDLVINRGFELKFFGFQAFGIANFKIEKIRANVEKQIKVECCLVKILK